MYAIPLVHHTHHLANFSSFIPHSFLQLVKHQALFKTRVPAPPEAYTLPKEGGVGRDVTNKLSVNAVVLSGGGYQEPRGSF